MTNGNMVFAKRIKALREQGKLSQEELAKKFNYNKQAVSHWENSGKIPRDSVLKQLAFMFNTSTDYLLGNSDNLSPINSQENKPFDVRELVEHAMSEASEVDRLKEMEEKFKSLSLQEQKAFLKRHINSILDLIKGN
ncbi:MAG: helix-turn-helix transcriptional regulator [Negativicutes bacterium]|nr:helix-turn-helix transcriptional regulator [Negativicutes bacterium]